MRQTLLVEVKSVKTVAWSVLSIALFATLTRESSIDDANAGQSALGRGDNNAAIRLFTQALDKGDLTQDDQELAHIDRGKAYSAINNYAAALMDFKAAVRLKPTDNDAFQAMQAAFQEFSKNEGILLKTVDRDQPSQILTLFPAIEEDCSIKWEHTLDVIQPPSHGEIWQDTAMQAINYNPGSRFSRCRPHL